MATFDIMRGEFPNQQYATYINSFINDLPRLTGALNSSALQSGRAEIENEQQLAPMRQELMMGLLERYAPQLATIGSRLNEQMASEGAAGNRRVLEGSGGDYLRSIDNTVRQLNPEYFRTLGDTSTSLRNLMGSIDLSGNLSGGEREEVARGAARESLSRGDFGAPSTLGTVSNAMRFGQAGRNRQLQNQSMMSNAISNATQFAGISNPNAGGGSGIGSSTANAVATGANNGSNIGMSGLTGMKDMNTSTGQNLFGQQSGLFGGLANTGMNVWGNIKGQQMNIDANKKDWLDKFQQFTGALGNLGSE
jgi:hypothetical protein